MLNSKMLFTEHSSYSDVFADSNYFYVEAGIII